MIFVPWRGPVPERDSRLAISRSGTTMWQYGTAMLSASMSWIAFMDQGLALLRNSSVFSRSTAIRREGIEPVTAHAAAGYVRLVRVVPDLAVQVDAIVADQRLVHREVLVEKLAGLQADAKLCPAGWMAGQRLDVASLPFQPARLDLRHRLRPVPVFPPQPADLRAGGSGQDHQFGELAGLAREPGHPLDGGRVHQPVRAAQDRGTGFAVEGPAKVPRTSGIGP